jgi:hypothetical protein
MDAPGGQNGYKGPRREMTAISEEGRDNRVRHRRVDLRIAITSGKRRNSKEDPL